MAEATEYVDAGRAVDQATLTFVTGSAPPVARNVTYERILRARSEPHNWLTYYGAYDGQRYSPLEQINTQNVRRLTPAWVFQCGATGLQAGATTYAFEAAPVVVDGVMYVTGWDGWCWALDARTGEELWRYKHAIPFDVSLCCGNVNRGVAVAQGLVQCSAGKYGATGTPRSSLGYAIKSWEILDFQLPGVWRTLRGLVRPGQAMSR